MLFTLLAAAAIDLRLELVRESLTGTHYRYRQYVNGEAVAGGEVNVSIAFDGTKSEVRSIASGAARVPRAESTRDTRVAPLNLDGKLVYARREIVWLDDLRRVVRYVDDDGTLFLEQPQFAHARVFDPNPVTKLNDPTLRDQNDSAAAVPPLAYSDVTLERLNASGPLGGTYAQIVDAQNPAVPPVQVGGALDFDRSASGFEDVNAYFHMDRSQQSLQRLGYTGGRAIAPYAVEADTHAANGRDDSFFVASTIAGRGSIFFGEGGTDDAEDGDLVVHEYAHAIHEWISPGTFLGAFASQGRAISEGFGDYWAFSATYDASLASGRDPFCFADWDARCAGDAESEQCGYNATSDCLRRLDGAKTMADYVTVESSGTEHRNGEIWSSALREMFMALRQRHGIAGKAVADTVVVESLFGASPNPSFAGIAQRMIAADRLLYGGVNGDVICAAMMRRGILTGCAVPRGEFTLFQSLQQGVPIPDDSSSGVTLPLTITDTRLIERLQVSVVIRHPLRGDLALVLIAPDGSETPLQNFSNDRAADIVATYGRDAIPVGSLDRFRGRSAAGTWRLRVIDLRPRDAGTLVSWSLAIQFAGDAAAETRPAAAERQIIPAAAHAPGANGTYWITDVRLFAARDTTATLIFTPSGADGRSSFAVARVQIAANTTVAFDDVVASLFSTAGTGQIEIGGEILATSRTYTRDPSGSYGQFIPPVRAESGVRVLNVPRAESNAMFRTNLGIAETAGHEGRVQIRSFDASSGAPAGMSEFDVHPYSHLQLPATNAELMTIEVEVVSGDARVVAYASIIDNASGDPTYISAPARPRGLAPVISAPGVLGTYWRSDVGMAALDVLRYTDSRTGRSSRFGAALIPPHALIRYRDLLGDFLSDRPTRGVLHADSDQQGFTQRIYTTGPRGSYGQSVPLIEPFHDAREILQVENSAAFRTNIGLMTAEEGATVHVTLFDSAGRELTRSEHSLGPRSLEQFQLVPPVVNGRVHVEVVTGVAAAYASVIDNRSGDPIFAPAQ